MIFGGCARIFDTRQGRLSAAYSIVRKRNLTPHRVKKTAQAWKIISFASITKKRYHFTKLRSKIIAYELDLRLSGSLEQKVGIVAFSQKLECRWAGIKTCLTRPIGFQKLSARKSKDERGHILRGIYEDNRSIQNFQGSLRRKAAIPRLRLLKQWLPLSALLIVFVAFGLYAFTRHDQEMSSTVGTYAAAAAAYSLAQPAEPHVAANTGEVEVKNLDANGDIPLSRMLNLGIRRIVLDAGHGGIDAGTVGRGKTMEKDITLAVAMKLRELLIQLGVADILMTRTDDSTISLQERIDYANEAKADMFVSIHVNSLPGSQANTIETFYFGPSDDSRTLQLADRENMGSEYGLSDFMEIVERLGKTMKLQESKKLAETIQKALYKNAKELDPDAVDAGVKKAPFVVLMGLNVPSVLAEIACMSNDKAEHDLNSEENQYRIAAALAAGIMSYQNIGVMENGSR